MLQTDHLLLGYFSPAEIRLMDEGSKFPGINRSLEQLKYKRVSCTVLKKVCELAVKQSVIESSFAEIEEIGRVAKAGIDSGKNSKKSWNIHADVMAPIHGFPVKTTADIMGIEISWEPNDTNNNGELDDYGYEEHFFSRDPRDTDIWIARPYMDTPLVEVTGMLMLLDHQLKSVSN